MEQDENKKEDFFIKHQAETAGVAGEKVLKLFGTIDDLFLLSKDPKDLEKNDEAYKKLLAGTLEILSEHKVGTTNYNYIFDGIKSVVTGVQQYINNHASNIKREIESRVVAVKNPKDGKYDIDHATHVDLIGTVMRLRDEQGNGPDSACEDYFTVVEKKEDVVSPVQKHDL